MRDGPGARWELLAILAVATALRLPGCFQALWLDEVWTLLEVERMGSALEILTGLHDSNNHHLNTAIFYLVGSQEHWSLYRLHSLVAGVATVALAWAIARPAGRLEARLAAALTTLSYPLIHFSSEARGYALALLFAFASFLALRSFLETRRWLAALAFGIAILLGFASHLAMLYVLLASAVWLGVELWRCDPRPAAVATGLARCFALPALLLLPFYIVAIAPMKIGQAPLRDLGEVLLSTASQSAGGPADGVLVAPVALLMASLTLGAIVFLQRARRAEWLFYLIVIGLAPALLLAALRPDYLALRYYLIPIGFALVALAAPLAEGWRRRGGARLGVGLLLLLFCIGNAQSVAKLYAHGRGGYLEALRFITESTPGGHVTIASDHDFRNHLLVHYYQRFLPPGENLTYLKQHRLPPEGSDWMIAHRLGERAELPAKFRDPRGNRYVLEKRYPYAGLSGMHWYLYRRTATGAAVPGAPEPGERGAASRSLAP